MTYAPRDVYLLTWRPGGWYNKVDRIRAGGKIKGKEYLNKNAELGLWYGFESKEFDTRFRLSSEIPALNDKSSGSVMIQKMEGRFEIDAHLNFIRSKYLKREPKDRFWIGFNHSRLLDSRYTLKEFTPIDTTFNTWEEGIVNKLYVRYAVNPRGLRWHSNFLFGWDTVQRDWGSDYSYNALFSDLRFWLDHSLASVAIRVFGKKLFNPEKSPLQDQIFLDSANPRELFKRFYLRSYGSLPRGLNYHLPGGGNLRGYLDNAIKGSEILAGNFELSRRLGRFRPIKGIRPWSISPSITVFADAALMGVTRSSKESFANAGIGFRLENQLPDAWYTILTGGRNLTIRFDFPFWVSDPLPGEKSFKLRWLFGFEKVI
jgi:hypothetical protein